MSTTSESLLQRITKNPRIFGGKPIIRGQRMAVEHILGMLAAGDTRAGILEEFPFLEADDVQACLLYAQQAVTREHEVHSVHETSSS